MWEPDRVWTLDSLMKAFKLRVSDTANVPEPEAQGVIPEGPRPGRGVDGAARPTAWHPRRMAHYHLPVAHGPQ